MKDQQQYAIVAGGTGSVGEGIVKTLLENKWIVIVPGRTKKSLDNLLAYCNYHINLKTHIAQISKPEEANEFYSLCASSYPSIHLFIASLGGWRQGAGITGISWEEWQSTLEDNLSSHFLAMKMGFPLLSPEGTFIHINGLGAEAVIPGAGPTVAAAAAQTRLALTLAAEQKNNSVKVYELALGLVNTRARNMSMENGKQLVDPFLITEFILQLHKRDPLISQATMHRLQYADAIVKYLNK